MAQRTKSGRKLEHNQLKGIDLYLEEIYENSITAGNEMVAAALRNAQIRGLETLVTSTGRFSEIINYIKNQTGKDRRNSWVRVGPLLLEQLGALEEKARELGGNDAGQVLEIKLRLARGWAKQVVAHYLYSALHKT